MNDVQNTEFSRTMDDQSFRGQLMDDIYTQFRQRGCDQVNNVCVCDHRRLLCVLQLSLLLVTFLSYTAELSLFETQTDLTILLQTLCMLLPSCWRLYVFCDNLVADSLYSVTILLQTLCMLLPSCWRLYVFCDNLVAQGCYRKWKDSSKYWSSYVNNEQGERMSPSLQTCQNSTNCNCVVYVSPEHKNVMFWDHVQISLEASRA